MGCFVPEMTFFDEGSLVAVLTTEPLGRALDYKAPQGGCFLGAFVEVPLGPRRVLGVVWGAGEGGFDPARIRLVGRVLDAAPMGDAMRTFLMRAADYTLTPIPATPRLATRAPGLADPPGPRKVYRKGMQDPDRMTEARARAVPPLDEYGRAAFTLSELAELAGVTTSVIKGLVKRNHRGGSTARSGLCPARSGSAGQVADRRPDAGGRTVGGCGSKVPLWYDAPERCDRVGQDRSLSGSGCRDLAQGAAGAGAVAGNRLDQRVSGAGRGSVRF